MGSRKQKAPYGTKLLISKEKYWRRGPESNRPTRICNPVHNRFATAPFLVTKKGSCCFPNLQKDVGSSINVWSGIRGSNSRPIPWQGIALPTELIPHLQSTWHSMPSYMLPKNCNVISGKFKCLLKILSMLNSPSFCSCFYVCGDWCFYGNGLFIG